MERLLSYHSVLAEAVQLEAPAEVPQDLHDVVPGIGVALSVRHPGGQQRGQKRLERLLRTKAVGQVVDQPGGREDRPVVPLVCLPAGVAAHCDHEEGGQTEADREGHHGESRATDVLLLKHEADNTELSRPGQCADVTVRQI